MKRLFIYIVFITAFMIAAAQANPPVAPVADATRFFSAIQDMPVMPGLVELPDQGVMFDKPEGRIVESVAAIQSGSREAIRAYYDSVLPQLGWTRLDIDKYMRENEDLQLGFETNEGRQFLRIMVAPREPGTP